MSALGWAIPGPIRDYLVPGVDTFSIFPWARSCVRVGARGMIPLVERGGWNRYGWVALLGFGLVFGGRFADLPFSYERSGSG